MHGLCKLERVLSQVSCVLSQVFQVSSLAGGCCYKAQLKALECNPHHSLIKGVKLCISIAQPRGVPPLNPCLQTLAWITTLSVCCLSLLASTHLLLDLSCLRNRVVCNHLVVSISLDTANGVHVNSMAAADDFDPIQQRMSPSMQVYTHILQKGFQAGSIVGTCAVVPATVAYTALYRKAGVDLLQLVRRAGVSSVTGVTLTGTEGSLECLTALHDSPR